MKNEKTMRCVITALNFSPKGTVEGLQVEADDEFAQIVFSRETGNEIARTITIGQTLDLVVETGHSSTSSGSFHPVYQFISRKRCEKPGDAATPQSGVIIGVVARLNYARHGKANGVVLDSGDFIHLKPAGMRRIELNIGDRIEANGTSQMMELGGRIVEPTTINGVRLKGKH